MLIASLVELFIKIVNKSLGERDYAAQETMHHLLSLKLHSSSFNVIPVSLSGSRRLHENVEGGESAQIIHFLTYMLIIMNMIVHKTL